MSDRVRVPKDKEQIISKLFKGDNDKGVFNLRADIITFAAALGYNNDKRIPFSETLDPIRQDVFNRQGYDTVINLIALGATKDPAILMNLEEEEDRRIKIFEEYANGGLEILGEELKGSVSILDHILLMIKNERNQEIEEDDEYILSKFLK